MEDKRYTIGEKTFYQRDLKIGQVRMVLHVVKTYSVFNMNVQSLMELLTDQISVLLAIVLIEDGTTQRDKVRGGMEGVKALAAWLDEEADPADIVDAIQDFLASGRLQKAMTLVDVSKLMTPKADGLTI